MTPEQKNELLTQLFSEWDDCRRCDLCTPKGRTRRSVVFGEGNPDAHLMIIGEAPGAEEDKSGSPFVGKSGSVLNEFLGAVNSSRDEVFITNIVGCRPTEDLDGSKNREPSAEEIKTCLPRVHQIIDIVDPFVVLMLGTVAFKALAPPKASFSKTVSDPHIWHTEVSTPGKSVPVPRTGYVAYHPSYLLRNWDDSPTGSVSTSFKVWQKAFRVADTHAQMYRGKNPVERG